jgi:hypothetical protein
MRPARAWFALLLLVFPVSLFGEGKLESVREKIDSPSDEQDRPRKKHKHDGGCEDCFAAQLLGGIVEALLCGCEEDSGPSACGQVISSCGVAVSTPFWGPCALIGDTGEREIYFLPYPYADDFPGRLWLQQGGVPPDGSQYSVESTDLPALSPLALRISLENGHDFADLNRVGGQVILETRSRLGLHTSWNWYHENLGRGRSDETFLTDLNLTIRFAQSERVQMYAGLGARILADQYDADAGFNAIYGADFFPVRPLVLSWQIDGGSLGSAGVFHTRGSVGVLLRNWELFAGYDYLDIGGIDLQGPLIGVRGWF